MLARTGLVILTCPTTGSRVEVGIRMDVDSLASLAQRHSRIHCPLCGGKHELTKALLDTDQLDTPRLPGAHSSELASTRVWRVTGLAMREHPDSDLEDEPR